MESKLLAKLPKWNKPSKGKYLTLKEWLIYSIGGCGAMGAGAIIQYFTLSAGIYIAAAINMNVNHILYMTYATSIFTILTSPLMSWLIDNTNSKWGKFRPYLIILPLPMLIGFLSLGSIVYIQNYVAMVVVYAIVFNIVNFMNRLYTFAFSSLVQVISPSPEERTQVMSIGTFFASLGPTLVTMIYPTVANFLFSDGDISGVNTLKSTQILAPIIMAVFGVLGLLVAFGVKERVVLPKKFKQKAKFIESVKKSVGNKYFWITNISTILGVFKIYATTFTSWIVAYMIYPQLVSQGQVSLANFMLSIISTLVGDACVPGMLLAPWLIKKIGKRNLVIFSTAMTVVATIPMIFIKNPIALLVMIYLVTFFNGFSIVTGPAVQAEVYDYQQYKTGDRLEGFLSQFGTMITTAVGLATGLIAPAVQRHFGYIDKTDVLFNNDVLLGIVSAMSLIAAISGFLSIIPYLFYDLKPDAHKKIMQVLTVRAKYEDGFCDEQTRDNLINRIENGESDVLDYFKEDDIDENTKDNDNTFDKNGNSNISYDNTDASETYEDAVNSTAYEQLDKVDANAQVVEKIVEDLMSDNK